MNSTRHRDLTVHDVVPPEPPLAVRSATTLWFAAIGAGVVESVLGVLGALADGSSVFGLLLQVAFRAIVYGGLFVVVDRYFRHGLPAPAAGPWPRHRLAGGGTGHLVPA